MKEKFVRFAVLPMAQSTIFVKIAGRPSSAVFGGRKGDPYDRKNQKLYCYEPLTCKISEIYEAPEGSN